MGRVVFSAVSWFLAVLALIAGGGLMALGRWHQPFIDASAAVADGRLDAALPGFVESESRFDRLSVTKQLVPDGYDASIANQLAIMYQQGKLDELVEKAASAPSTGATHFWAGCALFSKGKDEEKPEARLAWLGRAEQEFKSALQLEPDDWNIKYDYELTQRLLAELRKQPKTPPKQLMQLLRPQPKAGGQPARRVG